MTGPISSTNGGMGGTSNLASVTVYVTLDIDASGAPSKYDALTDCPLLIRYLFGLRGLALTTGVIGTGAMRDRPQIEAYIQSLMP